MKTHASREEPLTRAAASPSFTRAFALQLDHGWFKGFDGRGRVTLAMQLSRAACWSTLVEPDLIRTAMRLLRKGKRFELIAVVPYIGYRPITQDLLDLLPGQETTTAPRSA